MICVVSTRLIAHTIRKEPQFGLSLANKHICFLNAFLKGIQRAKEMAQVAEQ